MEESRNTSYGEPAPPAVKIEELRLLLTFLTGRICPKTTLGIGVVINFVVFLNLELSRDGVRF